MRRIILIEKSISMHTLFYYAKKTDVAGVGSTFLSLTGLAEALRKELSALGVAAVLEMALVSTEGKVFYSSLSKAATSRISPFYESVLRISQGDNLSLALDSNRAVIASRVSNRAILIVLTDKKVGIVLTKMGSIADKFGKLLDELIVLEESKTRAGPPSKEALVKAAPGPPTLIDFAKEVQAPALSVRQPPEAPEKVVETPTVIAKELEESKEEIAAEEKEAEYVKISLNPWTILEFTPRPETEGIMLDAEMAKLLSSVDGWKSVDALAKENNVKVELALRELNLLTQKGVLKLKYNEPVYDAKPKVVAKLSAESSVMAIGASLGRIRSLKDVLKQIDGKKTVIEIARALEVDPEKMRRIIENMERRGIIKL